MKKLELEEIGRYVSDNISKFHTKRLESLDRINLEKLLIRKNPYLFKAKDLAPAELVKSFTDAHLSSNEETIFGTGWKGWRYISTLKFLVVENQELKGLISNLKRKTSDISLTLNPVPIGVTAAKSRGWFLILRQQLKLSAQVIHSCM
ncbi:hypothetical protein MASR2M39_26100 [Ignavibacteriales bacterium]